MRAIFLAGLLVAGAAFGGQALAQGGREKERPRPPPPPIMRCADLAIGDYTIGAVAPDTPPLAEGEVSVRWEVRNAGGAPYQGAAATSQWLSLEYTTPGGPQQIAMNPLPPAATPGVVTLGPGGSWRGFLRATVPAEASRRPLRLRLNYAQTYGVANDCDMDNNTAPLLR